MDQQNIPEEAISLHRRADEFHYVCSRLTIALFQYSGLCCKVSSNEKQLMSNIWETITDLLEKGIQDNWHCNALSEYADKLYDAIKTTNEYFERSKKSYEKLKQSIEVWGGKSTFVRDEPGALMDFTMCIDDGIQRHFYAVYETGNLLHEMIEENKKMFQCDPQSDRWQFYITRLNDMIESALKASIVCSLDFLIENTDPGNEELEPLVKIEMRFENEFIFTPPLLPEKGADIEYLISEATTMVFRMASKIRPIVEERGDYIEIMNECEELRDKKISVIQNVRRSISKVLVTVTSLEIYSNLWIMSAEDAIQDFLLYGSQAGFLEEEEEDVDVDEVFKEEKKPTEIKPPTEEEFRTEILQFLQVYEKFDEMPVVKAVVPWLLLDYSEFKEKGLQHLKQWIAVYKEAFIEQKSLGKLRKVAKDDY